MAAVKEEAEAKGYTDAEKVIILREHLQMAVDWWSLTPPSWSEKHGAYMSVHTLLLHLTKALKGTETR